MPNEAIAAYTQVFVLNMISRDVQDPLAPQREAALFYGLFLRGHSIDSIRRDIDVPSTLARKWMRGRQYEDRFKDNLKRLYQYRKQVLAIFNELVHNERGRAKLQ